MTLTELKERYDLSNIDLSKAIMRDPTYISKVVNMKLIPSLMMSLLIKQVTKGLVQPHDLIRQDDFINYFKHRQKVFSQKFGHLFIGGPMGSD